ncbi:MAG: hypothetical protein DMF65_03210 [Acidobacteria bacterium]|nr:MAG: hypothetical protein DMF65_03210 [Acidobacteriota bacterium]
MPRRRRGKISNALPTHRSQTPSEIESPTRPTRSASGEGAFLLRLKTRHARVRSARENFGGRG